jgi:arginase family enzyme
MWSTLLHAGLVSSFLRLPHLPPSTEKLASEGAGVAIYGIPWVSTVISCSGTNYGPRAIREAPLSHVHCDPRRRSLEALRLIDCGDTGVIPGNAKKTFYDAQQDLSNILVTGAVPVRLIGCWVPTRAT